jgi:hypothetical protein
MDHLAYQRQRHKQCAFNVYAAAMMQYALAPLCAAFGDPQRAHAAMALGKKREAATVKRFSSESRGLFVINLPGWARKKPYVSATGRWLPRSCSTCPQANTSAAVRAPVECPPEMGFSYPANAGWRLWALAKAGRADVIVKDLRERWATMPCARLNNALQEFWEVTPDSEAEWCHGPVAPLYITYMSRGYPASRNRIQAL